MKKNKLITKLFISCLTLSASLSLSEHSFAETSTQEGISVESSQKLSKIKESKQKFTEQKNKKLRELSTIAEKIQKIQINLDQLEKIESTGFISETSKSDDPHNRLLTSRFSPITVKENTMTYNKEQLIALKQKQALLEQDSKTISNQLLAANKQDTDLSEKIVHAQKQKASKTEQTDTRSAIVAAAKTHLGKPYVYGAAGPDSFDCSGLVQVAFAAAGRTLGRTTIDQETAGTTISVSEAQAGDLVFWGSHGGTYHVGISTGDGSYIHAPVPGDVVQVSTVASYAPDFAVQIL